MANHGSTIGITIDLIEFLNQRADLEQADAGALSVSNIVVVPIASLREFREAARDVFMDAIVLLDSVPFPAWDVLCHALNVVAQGGFQNGAALLADLHAAFDRFAIQAGKNPAEMSVPL